MPEQFDFPPRGAALNGTPAALFVPMSFSQEELGGFGSNYNKTVVARLKRGVSIGQARAEMGSLKAALVEQYPEDLKGIPRISSPSFLTGDTGRRTCPWCWEAHRALIVCADVANLMLTRFGSCQRKSLFARLASSARIVRQLLTESSCWVCWEARLGCCSPVRDAGLAFARGRDPACRIDRIQWSRALSRFCLHW
jgi:hypothetical protein